MTERPAPSPAVRIEQVIALVALATLPTLSLLPFGIAYLWERSWLLWWAGACLLSALLLTALTALLLRRRPVPLTDTAAAARDETDTALDPAWSPREIGAWRDVQKLATEIDVDRLETEADLLALVHRTIERVALRLKPEVRDPVWSFTIPEALAITEQVSRRLSVVVDTYVPFGDRLTIAQVLTVYRGRRYLDAASTAYDVWRVLRWVNPATAVTHEARERLTKAAFNWGRQHVSRRLVVALVHEVGRAAIDLYGGRLRPAVPALVVDPGTSPGNAAPQSTSSRARWSWFHRS